MPENDSIYFAYGSNLSTRRLEERIGPFDCLGIGRLIKYKLRFDVKGIDQSAKANIAYTGISSDIVWGVLYKFTHSAALQLDTYETGYIRRIVTILDSQERPIEAYAYIAVPESLGSSLLPLKFYKKYIVDGALEHCLPTNYINEIKKIETID